MERNPEQLPLRDRPVCRQGCALVCREWPPEEPGEGINLPRAVCLQPLTPADNIHVCSGLSFFTSSFEYFLGSAQPPPVGRSVVLTDSFFCPFHRRPQSSVSGNKEFLRARLTPHKRLCAEKFVRGMGSKACHPYRAARGLLPLSKRL